MNTLWGTRCYLAGPIDRVDDQGIGWRRIITPFLQKLHVIVMDPTDKPPMFNGPTLDIDMNRVARDKLVQEEKYEELAGQIKGVRHLDLRLVDITDFTICSMDSLVHMCGTYEEVFTGNRQKKPILCYCMNGKDSTPHWMFGVLPHQFFFDDVPSIIDYLDGINKTAHDPFHSGRWLLFDWKKIYDSGDFHDTCL